MNTILTPARLGAAACGRVQPSHNLFFLKAFAMLILFGMVAFGQNGASLTGAIRDPQGRPVKQAQVRLFEQGTGALHTAVSQGDGRYSFERLAAAAYLIEVEMAQFRTATASLTVAAGARTVHDVTLELAGVNQSVLVTAAGAPQQLDEIAKAANTISGDEIQNRNEYSLGEILRNTPGMLITNGGGPGQLTTIRLRGLRADATGVLVDGLRLRDTTTISADSSSLFSALNFIAADRVEVMRGSGSSLYGTNAVGGVVNVVTQQGGGPLHGQLQTEGGNLGFYRARGTLSGGAFRDRLKYTAGLSHLNVIQGVDGNDPWRSTGGQGFLRYDFTPTMNLSARLWGTDDFVMTNVGPSTTGIPTANFPSTGIIPAQILSPLNVALVNSGGQPDYTGANLIPGRDDPDSRRSLGFLSSAFVFRHALTPRVNWQASYQRVHTDRIFENGPGGGGFQPATSNFTLYRGDIDTAELRGTAQLTPWMSVTGGYEFERENYLDRQENNLAAPRTVSTRTQITQNMNTGYFATQMGLLGRKLQISLSGRAQQFSLSRPEFQFAGVATNYERTPLSAPPRALTGDAAVAYLLNRTNTKLRAHFGNAYRAPGLYERFGGGFSANPVTGIVGFTAYGDPRLAPDRYNSLDAGVDQYLFSSKIRLSATWFYTRMVTVSAFDSSGVIRVATDPYGRSSGYINGSGGVSRGFELGFEARPMRTLTFSGSYAYTRANLDRDLSVAGIWRVLGVPRQTATLVATKQWTRRLDTTVDIYGQSSYLTPFFAGVRTRAFELPGFSKTDLVANYRLHQGEKSLTRVYVKVDNLFAQRYYQNGWLAARANFVVGLGFGF